MTGSVAIAADFARVTLLFRDSPEAREEQRAAFRLLVSSLGNSGLVVLVGSQGLVFDQTSIPQEIPEVRELHAHLQAHGIGEIRIPGGMMTSTLLSAMRALAAPPGTYSSFDHLVARLDAVGAGIVQVFPPAATLLADIVPTELPPPALRAPEPARSAMPAPPNAQGNHPPAPTERTSRPEDATLTDIGPDAVSEAKVGMMHFVTMDMKSPGRVHELAQDLNPDATHAAASDSMNELIQAGEMAARQGEWEELLKAATTLVQLEAKGGETAEHRTYAIALRRMLPRSVLEHIAKLAAVGSYKTDAVAVLRRMGADATEVLLSLLAAAPTVGERRAYFSALTQMTEGSKLVVHMLGHDEWFVVRNIAELCGELHLEEAVPQLAKRINHSDERVRRAAAGALAKIGTSGAIEPLRTALKDKSPAVRLQAASLLDGKKAKGLAMTLAVSVEDEPQADVQREMLLALGRIASPEALQALAKMAEPGKKLFKRKPTALRLAAIDGFRAAGPSAVNYLKTMVEDEDREVRQAAEKALATLWE